MVMQRNQTLDCIQNNAATGLEEELESPSVISSFSDTVLQTVQWLSHSTFYVNFDSFKAGSGKTKEAIEQA